jgi:tetratricopeptide (TPR) repeat protein
MAVATFPRVAVADAGGTAWVSRAAAATFIASVLYLMLTSGASAQEDDGFGASKPLPPEEAQRVEQARKQATETLSRGDLDRARQQFEEVLKALPHDGPAERDAGRAAQAAGEFEYAAEALEKAHHFEGHKRDPELHYLRGEALFTLGRDEQAFREHRIAELEIGPAPEDRMQKLWLARIYARRGYLVLSDRIYDAMWPPPPKFDEEVALNEADAHLLNKDWEGGARVLRRYLALDPKNVRGREMLAWALEADGDLDGELAVRRSLVDDHPTVENERDYGRALERATRYREAGAQYHAAIAGGAGGDTTLVTSYDRMHYRVTPEMSGGGALRSDPQAWAWRVQAGAAYPFGTHHQAGLLAWHDSSTDWHANQVVGPNVLRESGSVTGLGGYAMFARRSGASLLVGGDTRFATASGDDSAGTQLYGPTRQLAFGGQTELDMPIAQIMQVNVHLDVNEQWNDAPVTVEDGGAQTGATGHFYLFPRNRVVLVDSGAMVRRLSLRPLEEGEPTPTASQLMIWAGIDFNLWTDASRIVRGETLDERMVRARPLNDAGVLAYRHFEIFANLSPDFRIALYPRDSIDNGTLILRKAFAGGRGGAELHGGLGYDNVQNQLLAQAGGAVVVASSWSTRLTVSYDYVHQSALGLPGTLQIGWVAFHADL